MIPDHQQTDFVMPDHQPGLASWAGMVCNGQQKLAGSVSEGRAASEVDVSWIGADKIGSV